MDKETLDYVDLLADFGEDRISDRCVWLNDCMQEFINNSQLPGIVHVSERVLFHVIIDYYADIKRLKRVPKYREDK